MTKIIYAWDLGATKCTAGLVTLDEDTHTLTCIKHFTVKLADSSSLGDLVEQIQQGLDFAMSEADCVCIGAAGVYDGAFLRLENAYPFQMNFAAIAKQFHWPVFAIIHDYAPIVCATFTSYMQNPENIKVLNSCPLKTHGRRVALGIGTGLGLKDGVLLDNGDFWLGQNEVGHIGVTAPPLAQADHLKRHKELFHFLREKTFTPQHQPLTFEKILSGAGTVRLYQFFYENSDAMTPEEVGSLMIEGKADEMLDAFAWYAGLFVGTVQLSFMPDGGVWITGGVALKNLHVFDRPDFFAGIHASPAYRAQRETYPLGVLCNPQHALVGCGYFASKRLLRDCVDLKLTA